ncbi:hypothetical protein [Thermococcus profundus]|uniref:hypothetical protein n=1 Tax=Thermococcus profundus TaxID=49899 RepID=UPI003001C937
MVAVDVLELLSRLVAFETVNDPERGIKPSKDCPAFIRDTLASWGIESEIIERDGYYAVYGGDRGRKAKATLHGPLRRSARKHGRVGDRPVQAHNQGEPSLR